MSRWNWFDDVTASEVFYSDDLWSWYRPPKKPEEKPEIKLLNVEVREQDSEIHTDN